MLQNVILYFINISAEILPHNLGYSFCAKHQALAHFWLVLFPPKALKIICTKTAPLGCQKYW
jgi:hypothetical protein